MLEWTNHSANIDWDELETLYRLAPLGNKSAEHLKKVFGNSRYLWFARENGKLVAAGRALADGGDCSYICDVAVLPSHQGMGLGREIVQRLLADSQGHKKIILYSAPGKEGFYKKFGFLRFLTAMAIFQDRESAIKRGHLSEEYLRKQISEKTPV
ncbi:MAG TPA: GNAT family N-acetyltransferase [Verrucomicrobiae bacterium]